MYNVRIYSDKKMHSTVQSKNSYLDEQIHTSLYVCLLLGALCVTQSVQSLGGIDGREVACRLKGREF